MGKYIENLLLATSRKYRTTGIYRTQYENTYIQIYWKFHLQKLKMFR